jgi:alcohol dehydrogenase class IV
MFEFFMGTRIFYGLGSRHSLTSILKDMGWLNVGVVIDHNVIETEVIKSWLIT